MTESTFVDNLNHIPLNKTANRYAKKICQYIWKGLQATMGNIAEEVDIESIAKK